jgi:hypothetical protein
MWVIERFAGRLRCCVVYPGFRAWALNPGLISNDLSGVNIWNSGSGGFLEAVVAVVGHGGGVGLETWGEGEGFVAEGVEGGVVEGVCLGFGECGSGGEVRCMKLEVFLGDCGRGIGLVGLSGFAVVGWRQSRRDAGAPVPEGIGGAGKMWWGDLCRVGG